MPNNRYEALKDAIFQLYTKEGRSKTYISKLLGLSRRELTDYINNVWQFPESKARRHIKPSTMKFLNKHKQYIKSCLDRDITIKKIAENLGCNLSLLNSILEYDPLLVNAKSAYINRIHSGHIQRIAEKKARSGFEYGIKDLPDEEWKPLLGYEGYCVSNMGRFKHYVDTYADYHLLTVCKNKNNLREYVKIIDKNMSVPRLVAHTFVSGYSSIRNTVNHIDGNVSNNRADNLEWVSQSENNYHAYHVLGRKKVCTKKGERKYRHFLYRDKYEFKTVAAFARFIGKSETQARRWLKEAEKHELKILDCND